MTGRARRRIRTLANRLARQEAQRDRAKRLEMRALGLSLVAQERKLNWGSAQCCAGCRRRMRGPA